MHRVPLVHEKQFAHAARETGYRSTAAAVSELVDNALQAGATQVQIHILERRVNGRREVTLGVQDDGCGMAKAELQQALQWGGSSRFNDRSGLGRFGMGLPNSSVSQARRLEVYTWRGAERPRFCYLDLDEVDDGTLQAIPRPSRRYLPEWASGATESGTLVVWSKCDRLDFKMASTLERKLDSELGRIFRRAIWDGLLLTINGSTVAGVDPLFLDPRARLSGAHEPVPPLEYRIRTGAKQSSLVRVRFSLLPVRAWHGFSTGEKRTRGIVGGAGVSVLRASREIAHGWYFMGGKRRQNYDDWWRVEVEFDPALDEKMGVTHSKQGIRPCREITEILSSEVGEIARRLSTQVRNEFASLGREGPAASATQATGRDWRLPRLAPNGSMNGQGDKAVHVEYRVGLVDSANLDFFTWELREGELKLAINTNHPFFRAIYRPVEEAGLAWVKTDLELMLLAYSRAEAAQQANGKDAPVPLRTRWSDVIATFLSD